MGHVGKWIQLLPKDEPCHWWLHEALQVGLVEKEGMQHLETGGDGIGLGRIEIVRHIDLVFDVWATTFRWVLPDKRPFLASAA